MVEIEQEMWRKARLRDNIRAVEKQILFLESLNRELIESDQDTSIVHNVLGECLEVLQTLTEQRDAAEQRVRAYVRFSQALRMQKGC